MQLRELCEFCDDFLKVTDFDDYCPNGLQVESKAEVDYLVCGVTASQALIEAAVERGADAILVHHGYFWKGESQPITGIKARRVGELMRNGISLLAYHLPLDAHPEVGNNVQLAAQMEWRVDGSFGMQNLIYEGALAKPQSIVQLAQDIESRLDTQSLAISAGKHEVSRLAWCTGAAQGFIESAAARGVDAFVSGEISEQTVHLARELGVHYVAAGHHATERFGVQALGSEIARRFGIRQEYVDIPNPA